MHYALAPFFVVVARLRLKLPIMLLVWASPRSSLLLMMLWIYKQTSLRVIDCRVHFSRRGWKPYTKSARNEWERHSISTTSTVILFRNNEICSAVYPFGLHICNPRLCQLQVYLEELHRCSSIECHLPMRVLGYRQESFSHRRLDKKEEEDSCAQGRSYYDLAS